METAIYVRVSTEEQAQEGFSIRAQEQKLKDYTKIKDWSIYKLYMDEGISGKNLVDRPAMQEMIADIQKGAVKNVLVFKIDRLTRSTADLIYLVDLFNQHDCAFNSLTESIDTGTASGRMFLKIIGIFAEFERENIIERITVGIERKVREGYNIGGQASYGYDRPKNQKVQTINQQEAAIVREIFDMYVMQGVSITDIARRLNVRKIPTKMDVTWENTNIRRLLSNANYVGHVRHHLRDEKEYSVEGRHEAIISQELFAAAQKLLSNNKKATPRKNPREDNYFTGFLVCGQCGYRMATHNVYNTLKDGTQSVTGSYLCRNKTFRVCTACSVSHKKVEKAFKEYIENIGDLEIDIQLEERKKQENLAQIEAYTAKYRHMEAREHEALTHYVDGKLEFDDYREVKRLVDKEKTAIRAELERLEVPQDEPKINKADIIRCFRTNWALLSTTERRQFLVKFVEKILVSTQKADGEHYVAVDILDVVFRG